MRRFPGRTLEELDEIDVGRFLRAVQAERMEGLEERRKAYLKDGSKTKLTDAEWQQLDYHERLLTSGGHETSTPAGGAE